MISILYRSKMQKSGHGLTLQNGMDRGSFSTFSAVLLFVVSSLPLVRQTESFMRFCLYSHISLNMYVSFCCDGQIPHKAASLPKSKAMTKLVMPLFRK